MSLSSELELIDRSCEEHPWSSSEIENLLAQPAVHVLSFEGKGWVLFQTVSGEAEILRFGVLPSERRKGIGSALLSMLLEHCKQRKIVKIFLEVREGAIPAISLYKKMGFKVTGRREGYYRGGESACLMCLSLLKSIK